MGRSLLTTSQPCPIHLAPSAFAQRMAGRGTRAPGLAYCDAPGVWGEPHAAQKGTPTTT